MDISLKNNKHCILVFGPEGSGTKFVTSVFCRLGWFGDYGWEQRLDSDIDFHNENRIVFRRSFPHGNKWCNIKDIEKRFADYNTSIIVMFRDWHTSLLSQTTNGHVGSPTSSLQNLRRAYHYIFKSLSEFDNYVVISLGDILGDFGDVILRKSLGIINVSIPTDFNFKINKKLSSKYF